MNWESKKQNLNFMDVWNKNSKVTPPSSPVVLHLPNAIALGTLQSNSPCCGDHPTINYFIATS